MAHLTRKLQGVFFDLDGTLADTLPALSEAAEKTALVCHLRPPSQEQSRSYVGNGINMLLCRVIAGRREVSMADVDADLLHRTRAVFDRIYAQGLSTGYRVYDGVCDLLDFLHLSGIKTAVVTNKPEVFAVPLLKYMGLYDRFDFVLGGEVIPPRKPDPRPLVYTAQKLGCDVRQCVMVGDSDNDVLGGQRASMCTIFIEGGYYTGDISAVGPDYTVADYKQLRLLFESVLKQER